jgi:PAS domain-containing protein
MTPGEWDADERALLDANIAARRPFLDFVYSRKNADGSKQYLQVSGEPMFDPSSRFVGYRGIGMDITGRMNRQK